ncbi:MAG: hypothetical protein V4717_03385 [Bacteroidota bacterium]
MKGLSVIILFQVLVGSIVNAQELTIPKFFPALNSFPLIGMAHGKLSFINTSEKTLRLLVFISPECPLCQNYSATLNAIQKQYKQQVRVIGIIPGNAYDFNTVRGFRKIYKTDFDFYIDSSMELTNYLQATVTPQVMLLNESMQLVYSGAIDNWAVTVGKKRLKATAYYALDAIENILRQQPVLVSQTKPVGCKINDF